MLVDMWTKASISPFPKLALENGGSTADRPKGDCPHIHQHMPATTGKTIGTYYKGFPHQVIAVFAESSRQVIAISPAK